MKTILTAAAAALTLGGALVSAVPASAEPHGEWRDGGRYEHHDGDGGGALAAGIAGLVIGAAIAGSHDGYSDGYYDGGSYAPSGGYYYAGPPPASNYGPAYDSYSGRCHTDWRWDRYANRYVRLRACD